MGETLRRTGAAGAEAAHLTAQVSAETTRRSVEALAEQSERIGQQMAWAVQESASDLRTFVIPPQGAGENLRDLQDGVAGFVNGVVQSNVRMTQQLLQIANPGVVFDLQRRFARDYMDALLHGSARSSGPRARRLTRRCSRSRSESSSARAASRTAAIIIVSRWWRT